MNYLCARTIPIETRRHRALSSPKRRGQGIARYHLKRTLYILGIIVIIAALVLLGAAAAIVSSLQARSRQRRIDRGEYVAPEPEYVAPAEGCCGQHATCEADSLLAAVSSEIVYYEDEELDRYRGTSPEAYSEAAVEEFRDVLLSLQEDEVSPWVRSLQLRGLEFPEALRPELYLLVGEQRAAHALHGRPEEAAA